MEEYHVTNFFEFGVPLVEISGTFNYKDIYGFIGQHRRWSTFYFRDDSEMRRLYGARLNGIAFYKFKEYLNISKYIKNKSKNDLIGDILHLDIYDKNLSVGRIKELKYLSGIKISDIEKISFFVDDGNIKKYDNRNKLIPNTVHVSVNLDNFDANILNYSHLVSKLNSGVELVKYEKEELIGGAIAIHGGVRDELLSQLDFNRDDVMNSLLVWKVAYEILESKNSLSNDNRVKFEDLKFIWRANLILKVWNEVKGNVIDVGLFNEMLSLASNFTPSILLYGKRQIFWDVDSFMHICFGHYKRYQVGSKVGKTEFLYRICDLKDLIIKVLESIEVELRDLLQKNSGKNIYFVGDKAVLFNDDYYHLRIDSTGRLFQFHRIEN